MFIQENIKKYMVIFLNTVWYDVISNRYHEHSSNSIQFQSDKTTVLSTDSCLLWLELPPDPYIPHVVTRLHSDLQ